jgi:hypothetical protein
MRPIEILAVAYLGLGTACVGGDGGIGAEIRVLQETYEFRGESYSSIGELEAVLDGMPGEVVSISASTCAAESRTADLVRAIGKRQVNVAFSTFEDVCQ